MIGDLQGLSLNPGTGSSAISPSSYFLFKGFSFSYEGEELTNSS